MYTNSAAKLINMYVMYEQVHALVLLLGWIKSETNRRRKFWIVKREHSGIYIVLLSVLSRIYTMYINTRYIYIYIYMYISVNQNKYLIGHFHICVNTRSDLFSTS